MLLPAQLLKRRPDTHKGDYGHVLIAGGSVGLCGAVCLAAEACLRMGAGKVSVAVPKSLVCAVHAKLSEAIVIPLPETDKGSLARGSIAVLQRILGGVDVVALGMGAGTAQETTSVIQKMVGMCRVPLVLDADGINAFAGKARSLKGHGNPLILTPHPKEFSRLINVPVSRIQQQRKRLAKEFAIQYNLILVLKGHRSLVVQENALFENTTGNPGMATAGSGDVLSGIIAALLAQKVSAYEAACTGVYVHGLAGDIAAREKTEISLIASDIIDYIPEAIKAMSRK